ncbi:type II toxin-antitoxin system prevent-host-death family antitoxin [Corallococcus exiguus]|nr:type II toxin-antitoxin system prevent-host-death family antitoxin [Corallococcus exiguus]
MSPVTFTDLRNNLATHLDRVEADRTELVVTRQNHEPVVIVTLAEWEGMKETLHLLGTPANAEHLLASIDELTSKGGTEKKLIER